MENKTIYAVSTNNKDKKENETHIYRHPNGLDVDLKTLAEGETLQQLYKKFLEQPEKQFIGERKVTPYGNLDKKFTWYSRREIFDEAERLASGIRNMNLVKPIKEWNNMELTFIGIFSKNNVRYFVSDIACVMQNLTIIPLYDTLGEQAMNQAIDETKMETMFVEGRLLEMLSQGKRDKNLFKSLKNLIILNEVEDKENLKEKYSQEFNIIFWNEVLEAGQEVLPWAKVESSSIYTFSYTSGTTGDSKGAMISHRNLCQLMYGAKNKIEFNDDDVHISYLPMPHILERAVFNMTINYGLKLGVYSGDVKKLLEDIQILRPTFFVSVPRLLNKIHDSLKGKIQGQFFLLRKILENAISTKLNNLEQSSELTHWFYDKTILKKMKNALGGKVRFMVTGSAPINKSVLDFLKVAFGCNILEVYGQTEATGLEFGTNILDHNSSGHVGGPTLNNEFKLVDVPHLDYYSTDKDEQGNPRPRGEIWVRGPNVIPGYYKKDDKNKETFTEDGWLKSGDIGMIILPEGILKIIDRKKNIFKLSQGEYIAPEKLENAYIHLSNLVDHIFVYGDSLKSCLVAVINLTPENLKKLAKSFKIAEETNLETNEDLKKKLLGKLEAIRKEHEFNGLEKIKDLIISCNSWENDGLLTTTMKKKRHKIQHFFQKQIDEAYKNLY